MNGSNTVQKVRRISSSGHKHRRSSAPTPTSFSDRPTSELIQVHESKENSEPNQKKRTYQSPAKDKNYRESDRCGESVCKSPYALQQIPKKRAFRASIRDAKPSDEIITHDCPECARFVEFLILNGVSHVSRHCISRHKAFCELSHTPPNIWLPWSQESQRS